MRKITPAVICFTVAALSLLVRPQSAVASGAKLSVAIQIDQVGGFVGPNFKSARLPIVIAYSDGRVMAQRNASGSAKEMYQSTLTASVLKSQISLFLHAIQTPTGGWGMPGVADVPSTVVVVTQNGKKSSANVYALGFTSKTMTSTAIAARTRLSKTIAAFGRLAGTKSLYAPSKYEVWPGWIDTKQVGVGMANPAAVFCLSQNGTLVISSQIPTPPTPLPDSSVSYCHLSDGTYAEEWAYFRQASKTGLIWPASVPSPTARCTVVAAKPLLSLLRKAGSKQWLLPSGAMTAITWRPVLPLEIGCKR